MDPSVHELQARMRTLRERYAAQLPDKLEALRHQWERVRDKGVCGEDMAALHRQVHSLTGSGATFGFVGLSETARTLERALKALIAHPDTTPCEAELPALADMFAALCASLGEPPLEVSALPLFRAGAASPAPCAEAVERALVYLVGADELLVAQLTAQLANFGYQVVDLAHAAALAQALAARQPAAIIIDSSLSDDVAAASRVIDAVCAREEATFAILCLSSRNDLQARLEAVRAGADAYFVKPVNVDSLVDSLERLTRGASESPYRVLIVDDDPLLAAHYAGVLEQAGIEVAVVNRPLEIMNALATAEPELILMDVYMPGCSGLELARLVRQQDAYLSIPIVFLSSENDLHKQLRALRIGGDEFLTKPISDHHLLSCVVTRAERARLINSLMVCDSLTGLLKHAKIKERLVIEQSRSQRCGASLAFAMIDIDNFKSVNDSYGHMVGDRVLKSLARLLQQRLRKSDCVGRYGGEEFAVILPDCDMAAAMSLMEEVRSSFAAVTHVHDGRAFSVTLSAGVAVFPDYTNADDINRAADEALYEAKRLGRNRVRAAGRPAPERGCASRKS